MKVNEIKNFLEKLPNNMEVELIKYPSKLQLFFLDKRNWYICKKTYIEGEKIKDEESLVILIHDE